MNNKELSGEQRRQLIDAQQNYEVLRVAAREKRRRFAGGMRWAKRESGEYLLRKIGMSERSLGPRSVETERMHDAFVVGRAAIEERLDSAASRLDTMAPINRAMGIGRLPTTPARILRECDARELLGGQIFVVGTNALYAYEALAGIHFESGLIATADIDLLFDARQKMSIVARKEVNERGLIGILQRADKSFAPQHKRAFRAVNKNGYLVDFIRPQAKNVLTDQRRSALSDGENDLEGAAISGLDWLINAPKVETIVIAESGVPAPIAAVDPRVYALHKFWLAKRPDRSPLKTVRDRAQAEAVAAVAIQYLNLDFSGADLAALPEAIRELPSDFTVPKIENEDLPDW